MRKKKAARLARLLSILLCCTTILSTSPAFVFAAEAEDTAPAVTQEKSEASKKAEPEAKAELAPQAEPEASAEAAEPEEIPDEPAAEEVDEAPSAEPVESSPTSAASTASRRGPAKAMQVISDEEPAPTVNYYEFYDSEGNLLATQTVKEGDTLNEPQIPKTVDNRSFAGWFDDEDQEFKDFGEVGAIETPDLTIKITAKYDDAIYLYYHDQYGNRIKSQKVQPNETVTVEPDAPMVQVTPLTQCQDGWSLTQGGTEDVSGPYTVGTESVDLYPILKEGYWVTFDSKGGTAVQRQFIAHNAPDAEKKATEPGTIVKKGYEFAGWFADEACTTEYDFDQIVEGPITIYAKWNPKTDTEYTVKYYYEYESDVASQTWDYKYLGRENRKGTTGEQTEYDKDFIFNAPYSLDKHGYELNEEKTKTEKIAADGTTVMKVYFKCQTYDLAFEGRSRDNATKPLYPDADGNIYKVTYTGLKYSQNIKFIWDQMEKDGFLGFAQDNDYMFFSTEGDNHQISPYYESLTKVESCNRVYALLKVGAKNSFYNLFLEILDGVAPDGYDAVANVSKRKDADDTDAKYYLKDAGSFNSYANGCLDFPSKGFYPGFTLHAELSDGHYREYKDGSVYIWYRYHSTWSTVNQLTNEDGTGLSYWGKDMPLNVYFLRNNYNLTFHMNGGSEPSTNARIMRAPAAEKVFSVPYERSLKGYEPSNYVVNETTMTLDDGQEMTFKGWFKDAACTEEMNFDATMPADNVDVYAKWAPKTYTVTFDSDGGTPVDKQSGIVYNDTASKPADPTYDEHVFLGWTLNGKPYNFGSGVTEDRNLVAEWRSVEAYNVIYDLNGGSGKTPSDSKNYYEKAGVTVKSDSGVKAPEGKVFLGWKADSDDQIYYPNASVSMPMGGLTLTAQWGDKDKATKVTYDFNFDQFGISDKGSKSKTVKAVPNNSKFELQPFSSMRKAPKGWTFAGWYKDKGCTEGPLDTVFLDNNDDDNNIVYAKWERELVLSPDNPDQGGTGSGSEPGGKTGGKIGGKIGTEKSGSSAKVVTTSVETASTTAPATGDTEPPYFYGILMILATLMLAGVIRHRRNNG